VPSPIDWTRPWFAGLRRLAPRLPAEVPTSMPVAELLNALAGPDGPRFVQWRELPQGQAYETYIDTAQAIPTRDNRHDLFNGLVWLCRPALKRRLNQLQAAAIARDGIGPRRGPLRDALTLFDESGALWADPHPGLLRALRDRDWPALFVHHRALWAGQRFEVIGHALLEQLSTAPRKALTAHVLAGPDPLVLGEEGWAAKPFLTLPVSGIPGWWPGQSASDFYDDPKVFRKPVPLKSATTP
jgi:hypothetical protein